MATNLSMELLNGVNTGQIAVHWIKALLVYALLRCSYLLFLHPASKYPGPRLAAISNVWYAYHWVSGKYPFAVEKAIRKYGDVVRVAPNELAFVTPQAASDIYGSHTKHLEHFAKTDFFDFMGGYNGLTWERVPELHRERLKQISPAFSTKAIRAKEPVMHKYIDLFVRIMAETGGREEGIELRSWTEWTFMDISAELMQGNKMRHLESRQGSPFPASLWGLNFFLTVNQVLKKFPLLEPIKVILIPPKALLSMISAKKTNVQELERRIARRGTTKHLDHFDQLLPSDAPEPDSVRKSQLATICAQLLVAGWEPVGSQFQCCIMFALHESKVYKELAAEIRGTFKKYEDIAPEALADLPWLHAALMETLRITVIGGHGLPRVSPGAMVDGHYIPKGVQVQFSHLAFTRRYFHQPRAYRPERWLPKGHPFWDEAFKDDALEDFFPFSQGPRSCIGMQLAWRETRLFIAKVLWSFDVEILPCQKLIDFDTDFKMHGMWDKPDFWVRFHPVAREE